MSPEDREEALAALAGAKAHLETVAKLADGEVPDAGTAAEARYLAEQVADLEGVLEA